MNELNNKKKLFFYLDPAHFPEKKIKSFEDLSAVNIDNRNTWNNWTIKTYLYLKDIFNCQLINFIPPQGIILYFRGSVDLRVKPNAKQFFVCMVADATWHPYAQINIFQNLFQAKLFKNGIFMPHWLMQNIVPNTKPFTSNYPKITHFGDPNNLDPYFSSAMWHKELKNMGYEWIEKSNAEWNNYENIDIIVAARQFNSKKRFLQKPASKLINAWHGGVVPILGKESGFQAYRQCEEDYIEIDSVKDLKCALLNLKKNENLSHQIIARGKIRALEINNDVITKQWISLLNNTIYPQAFRWMGANKISKFLFIVRRFLIYKSSALINRVLPNKWLGIQ